MTNYFNGIRLFGALLCTLFTMTSAQAMDVAGVRFEDHIKADNSELQLNGAGVRTKVIFKVYAAGLYLPQRTHHSEEIVSGAMPCRLVLHMLRNVEGNSLLSALKDGLRANLSDTELNALQSEMGDLTRIFQRMGTAREGDAIALDFNTHYITLSRNDMTIGQMTDGAMTRALLKVWLGEKPAEASLKKALLGN